MIQQQSGNMTGHLQFCLGRRGEVEKVLIVEVLYLDLKDLQHSKLDGWCGCGGGGESYSLYKQSIGCISPPPSHPPTHFRLSQIRFFIREQRGYPKFLILIGTIIMLVALGPIRVRSPPEQLISDHRHITVRGYEPNTNERKLPSRWQTRLACENTVGQYP